MTKTGELKLVNLVKEFVSHDKKGMIRAVDSINLTIPAGELCTLLGPSGCGKTTTLRMVAGFEHSTSGQILLDGESIEHILPSKRNMAMMFQSYALFPHMTVEKNIRYGLKVRKLPEEEIDRRTKAIIELMRLTGMENRLPSQISGGQQQRVALARAVVIEPRILLFDEPLSNLDAKLREYMRDELRALQQRLGITSLYVTHDQSEAMAISDRIVLMNKGRIEQVGTPQDLYQNPNSLFVADFIGKSNVVPCKLVKVAGEGLVVEVDGQSIVVPNPGRAFHEAYEKADKNTTWNIVFRPEFTRLCPVGEGMFTTSVKRNIFAGEIWETILEPRIFAHLPIDCPPAAEGEKVDLKINCEYIRILPGE